MSNEIYSWVFSDKKERWLYWYIIAFSMVIWLAIWWILTKQYVFSFIIFLLTGIMYFVENNSDDEINVSVTALWIKIGDIFYNYEKINNYSFIYLWEHAQLLRLNLKTSWINKLDLNINNEICQNLKDILPDFIKETDQSELSFSEKLINFLKL